MPGSSAAQRGSLFLSSLSLRSRLILLVLVTAAPLVVFAAGLVLWHSEAEKELLHQQAARTAEGAMQTIDRELSGAITGLQVLAASPALERRDFATFHGQARSAEGIAGNSVIILYDRAGNRIVSTAVPHGQALPPRRDMSALSVPFQTGKPHVTQLFVSETVGRPTVGVLVPVVVGGEVEYVLGAGLLSEALSERLKGAGVPRDWIATLLDQQGTLVARTHNPQQAVGRKALPQNWAYIQAASAATGTFTGTSQEGERLLLAFARSPSLGWTTVVGIPVATLEGQLHTSLQLVGLAGAVVVLLASLLVWWAARRIYGATQRLDATARALEAGRVADTPPTGIEEFDRLARTMREAGHRIEEREARLSDSLAELRQAHATLRGEQVKKDQFIAMLAHELRNPLAPIRTGVYLLGKSPPAPLAEKTLAMMERQLGHMVRLIDDLLDVSRIARGKLVLQTEDAVLQDVVSHAVDASQPFFAAGGPSLAVHLPEEPIWVHMDVTRISQAVANLLNNAAKFTPPGGSVTLDVRRDGEQVEIRVADTGVGIPPERLSDIFELFAQIQDETQPAQPGLGIGLSIARRLAELHGGTIEAHSDGPGRGSTFVIRLPALPLPVRAPSQAQQQQRPAAHGPLCVLVVDDNADAADTMATALRLSGHRTHVAHDGITALRMAMECNADLVLLDIGMPGMDGYELCRRLRATARYAKRKIVAVTGWGAAADRERARAAGFDAHFTKPVDWAQIEQVVYGA